jgi:NADPH-dependent 2,4-dienoyl-CoA reductase/sulfur reductase-like enzyme
LREITPDEVVVATGAKRTMPPIPGGDRDFVFSGDDMRSLVLGQNLDSISDKTDWKTRAVMKLGAMTGVTAKLDVLRMGSKVWMPIGKRVVIIGGELVGLELAEFLGLRGRDVTVLEESSRVGRGLQLVRRFRVVDECHHLGVTLNTLVRDVEIGDHVVSYVNDNGQRRTIPADTVIVARGATGDTGLAEQIAAAGYKVSTVGDCTGVGYIEGAMRDAALAVQNI